MWKRRTLVAGHISILDSREFNCIAFFNIEEDEQALSQIKLYYPNCIVEQINIASLVKDGGGLNCVTWCRYCESVDCVFM